MKMLCYGDSNTYGYDPRGFFGDRYPKESRWVDILAEKLGWQIQNEGQNGREIPSRPLQYQYVGDMLLRSVPDVIAGMLGTNDLLRGDSAAEICSRMEGLLRFLQPRCGQLLLIAPPPLKRGEWVTDKSLIVESVKLEGAYQARSRRKNRKVRNHLYQRLRTFVVRVARLELAASWSQTRRPTNWATPGYCARSRAKRIIHNMARKCNQKFLPEKRIVG